METGQVVAVAFVGGIMLLVVLVAFRARRRNQQQHPRPAVESGGPAYLDQAQAADQPLSADDEPPSTARDDEQVDRAEVFGGPAGGADADPDPSADDIPTPPVGGHPVDVLPGPDTEDRTERLPVSVTDPLIGPPDRVDSSAPTHALPVVTDPPEDRQGADAPPSDTPPSDAPTRRHARSDANVPVAMSVPPRHGSGGRHRAPSDGPQPQPGGDDQKTEPRGAQIVPDMRLPEDADAPPAELPSANGGPVVPLQNNGRGGEVPLPREPMSAGHDADDDVTTDLPVTDPTGRRNGGGEHRAVDQEKPTRSLADRLLGRRR